MITYRSGDYVLSLSKEGLHHKYWLGLHQAYARHGLAAMAADDILPSLVVLGTTLDGRPVGGLRVNVVTPRTCSFAGFWRPSTEEVFAEPRGAWSDDRGFSPSLARAFHHAIYELGFDHAWFAAHQRGMHLWEGIGSVVPVPAVEYPKGYQTSLLRMDYGHMAAEHQDEFAHETSQLHELGLSTGT